MSTTGSPSSRRRKTHHTVMSLKATGSSVREQIEHRVDQLSSPRGVVGELIKLKDHLSTLRGSHRKEVRNQLAIACDLAAFLRDDKGAWIDFCQLPEWRQFRNRPTQPEPTDPLGYVLRYAIGFKGRAATKKVSKYRKALIGFFEGGVPHTQISSKIKEGGGLEKLARSNAKPRKPAKKIVKVKPETSIRLLGRGTARFLPANVGSRLSFDVVITERQGDDVIGKISRFKIHSAE